LRRPLNLFTSRRARRILLFVLAGLVAWSLVAWIAARALIVSAEVPNADALVVLAGSSGYLERTHLAAKLFHQDRAPEIILTNDTEQGGWSNELQRNPFFIELAATELTRAGVPESKIERLEKAVSSTHDEALLLRDYAAQRGLRSILIVTSAYHSRRALWTFRRVFAGSGVEIGLSVVAPGEQSPSPATWWLQPRGWNLVAGEYVKLIYYRLAY
jgi:uncharacterized SAM-binding protein YcdF (DUF218 family)